MVILLRHHQVSRLAHLIMHYSSAMIESVEVYKSPEARLDEGA